MARRQAMPSRASADTSSATVALSVSASLRPSITCAVMGRAPIPFRKSNADVRTGDWNPVLPVPKGWGLPAGRDVSFRGFGVKGGADAPLTLSFDGWLGRAAVFLADDDVHLRPVDGVLFVHHRHRTPAADIHRAAGAGRQPHQLVADENLVVRCTGVVGHRNVQVLGSIAAAEQAVDDDRGRVVLVPKQPHLATMRLV